MFILLLEEDVLIFPEKSRIPAFSGSLLWRKQSLRFGVKIY